MKLKINRVEELTVDPGKYNEGDSFFIVEAGGIDPLAFDPFNIPRTAGRKFTYFLPRTIPTVDGETAQDPALLARMREAYKIGVEIEVDTVLVQLEPYFRKDRDGKIEAEGSKPIEYNSMSVTVRAASQPDGTIIHLDDPKSQAIASVNAYHVWASDYFAGDAADEEVPAVEDPMLEMMRAYMASKSTAPVVN